MKRFCVALLMIFTMAVSGCAGSGGGTVTTTGGAPTDLTAVWAQMKVLNDMIVGLGIDALKARVDVLAANDVALKTALDKEIADASARYAALNTRVTNVETVLADLQTQLNNIIANMATKSDVANLQAQITSAVANITSNTSAIMTLQTQVAAIQVAITALQNHDVTTDAQIAALQASIATLQATVADLQAQITALAGGMVKITTTTVGSGSATPALQYWPKNTSGATFIATPSAGSYFAGFAGCSGTPSGYSFTTNALLSDCTLTATFTTSPVYYLAEQWGSYGVGNGQFSQDVAGITVDPSGNSYVFDTDFPRIQKFDSNGNYVLQFGSAGSGNGQFQAGYYGTTTSHITSDSTGNIYVADAYNNRIQKFDSNGNYLMQFGNNATMLYPRAVAVDSVGNIYVNDSGNAGAPNQSDRVRKFDSNGNLINTLPSAYGFARWLAVDSSNNVYYQSAQSLGKINQVNSAGVVISTIATGANGTSSIWATSGVVKNNKLFVVVSDQNYITPFRSQIYTLTGILVSTNEFSQSSPLMTASIAVDSSDNFYLLSNSANSQRTTQIYKYAH